ncbi:MAG TPA: DUF6232 family protein [Chloroflexia bacterium]|nr:DUF6232 family protein [Chloroflexia bacterium]
MPAITYYNDKDVLITSETINLAGKVYPVSQVKSVKVWEAEPGLRREWPYLALTLFALLLLTVLNLPNLYPENWHNIIGVVLTLDVLFGVGSAGLLLVPLFLKGECGYMVGLRGTFGSSTPLRCNDEQHAQVLLDAIRLAIVNRGAVEAF